MNTLHDLLAQAFHDNHPGQVPEDPCPTCVQQADECLTVLRHTLQQHPEQIEELGFAQLYTVMVNGKPAYAPPTLETPE